MYTCTRSFISAILALALTQACGLDAGGDLSPPGQEALEGRSVAVRDDASSLDTSTDAVQPLSRTSSAEPQHEFRFSGVEIFAQHRFAPTPDPACVPSYGSNCTVPRLNVRVAVHDDLVRSELPGFDGLERVQVRVPFRTYPAGPVERRWHTLRYERTRPPYFLGGPPRPVDEHEPAFPLLLVDTEVLEAEGIEVRLETNQGILDAGTHRVPGCHGGSEGCSHLPRVGWSVAPSLAPAPQHP